MVSHGASSHTPVALVQQVAWDDLRIFLALARTGSTRQAAGQLGVNASTVSRKLAALEAALGTRLLERHPEGFRLTPAGCDVLEVTSKMNDFVRGMAHRVAGSDKNLAGRVRVTVPEVLSSVVADALRWVLEEHPGLEVEFCVEDRLVALHRHEADVAVRVSDAPSEDLVGRKIGRASVGVYGAERYLNCHPFELGDERHTWVEWPGYVHGKGAYAWLDETVPVRRIAVYANSAQAVCAAVAAGHGLSPLVHVHARRLPGLVSRWPLPERCATDIWALTHREMKRNARVRAVLEALGRLRV